MKEATRNTLIGAFVLLSLIALATLTVWFGETPSWLGGNQWTLRITNVEGLSGIGPGSPVLLNGVEIGRVSGLEFLDPNQPTAGVNVVADINDTYSVPVGATARVYGATLGFGSGQVDIVLGNAVPGELLDKKNASIHGEMRSIVGEIISKEMVASVEKMIKNIGDLAGKTTPFVNSLGKLTEPRSVSEVDRPGAAERGINANLSTAVERFDGLVTNLNTVLGDENVQQDVKTAVADLTAGAAELKETLALWHRETQRTSDNLNNVLGRTAENLDASFIRLNRGLESLDAAVGGFARVVNSMEEGRGTAGRLLHDERLYEAGVLTLQRLSELIATLQRIVGKAEQDGYVKISAATPFGRAKFDVATGKVAAKVIEKLATGLEAIEEADQTASRSTP